MKKLAILLMTILPFIGFSQNENNGFAYTKNPFPEAKTVSTTTKTSVKSQTNEMPSYDEDYFKLYDGSQSMEFTPVKKKNENVRIIRYNENPKVYYEVEVIYSDTKNVSIRSQYRNINAFMEKLAVVNNLPQ